MTQNLQDFIDNMILGYVNHSKMFTAYDISKAVQKEYHVNIRHLNMRDMIHSSNMIKDSMNNGIYSRTLIDLGGKQAYLYHPSSDDPYTYIQSQQPQAQSQQPQAQSQQPQAQSQQPQAQSQGSHNLGSRDRLLIPVKYMRNAGCDPGINCFVFVIDNSIFIAKSKPYQSSNSVCTKKVEKSGEIRIGSQQLNMAGLKNNSLRIKNSDYNNEVVVKISKF